VTATAKKRQMAGNSFDASLQFGDEMSKREKKGLVPADKLAPVLRISVRRIYQLAERGILPRAERGRFNLAVCMMAYIRHLQADIQHRYGLSPEDSPATLYSLQKTRTRWLRARADLAEHDLAQARAALMPATLRRVLREGTGEIFNKALAEMNERITDQIVGEDGLGAPRTIIKVVMNKEVRATLSAASRHISSDDFANDVRKRCELAGTPMEER